MKQCTDKQQTAKLIELGFEKPFFLRRTYLVGELIEILNRVDDEKLEICRDCGSWLIGTDLYCTLDRELIDALYDMITLLKEKGMI